MKERTEDLDEAGALSQSSRARRLFQWAIGLLVLLFLVTAVVPLCIFRGSLSYRATQISRLGGTITTGPPPIYAELAYSTKYPKLVRQTCTSAFGRWVFSQCPVVYSVDLRSIPSGEAVKSALQIASGFDHVREITLYQSAATDDHLEIVADGFPKLQRLKLNETAITDAGIKHLRKLPELQLLNAQRTALTDAAVPDLAAIHQLKELSVAETSITSVQPIRDAHPLCHINHQLVTRTATTDDHRRRKPSSEE